MPHISTFPSGKMTSFLEFLLLSFPVYRSASFPLFLFFFCVCFCLKIRKIKKKIECSFDKFFFYNFGGGWDKIERGSVCVGEVGREGRYK